MDRTASAARPVARAGLGVTGETSSSVPRRWREADFERLWGFVDRFKVCQAGFTILTPLPGHRLLRGRCGTYRRRTAVRALRRAPSAVECRRSVRSGSSSSIAALGQGRSVLDLRGRKRFWQWMREVEVRHALFLMRALRRTQRMMDPEHYLENATSRPRRAGTTCAAVAWA